MLNFLLVFTLLFSPTSSAVPASKHADLKNITENFFTLARITNAISLQASVLRQDIVFREVIAEFLRIDVGLLSQIVSTDVKPLISTLRGLQEKVQDVKTNGKFSLKGGVKNFLEAVSTVEKVITDVKQLLIDPKTESEDLGKSLIEATQEIKDFGDICSEKTLKKLISYAKRYEHANVHPPDEGTASRHLADFSEKLPIFMECIKKASKFEEKFNDLSTWKVYSQFTLAEMIVNKSETFQEVLQKLHDVKSDLETSHGLWKDEFKSSLLGNLHLRVESILSAHKEKRKTLEPKEPVLTVSFLEPAELGRISKDLENSWFKDHFIRGSPEVKKLSKALEPLQGIASSIQKLNDAWISFDQHIKDATGFLNVEDVSVVLKTFENFANTQTPAYIQTVEGIEESLKSCTFKPDDDSKATIERFFAQLHDEKKVLKWLSEIHMTLTEIMMTRNCFEELLQTFDKKTDHEKSADKLYNVFRAFYECTGQTNYGHLETHKFFDDFLFLQESVVGAIRAGEKYKNREATTTASTAASPPKVTFKDVLTKSKAVDTVNCLRDGSISFTELLVVGDFLKNITDFPAPEKIDYTVSYLERLITLEKALNETETVIRSSGTRAKRDAQKLDPSNPVLTLKDSRTEAENIGVCTLSLWNLIMVLEEKDDLLQIGNFNKDVKVRLGKAELHSFIEPEDEIQNLMKSAEKVSSEARKLKGKDPLKMAEIFDQVASINGIHLNRQELFQLQGETKNLKAFKKATKDFDIALKYNLHFATYRYRLLDGRSLVKRLQDFYNRIFGHVKPTKPKTVEKYFTPWLICIYIGSILLLIIVGFLIYGLTKKGREKYRKLYIYYFGKPEDFEKRWRYSCFMDKVTGENALLDSVRETNKANMLIALKRGVYVNAYNNFGNTALHAATKGGHPELVEILIRHGADRSLLNVKNRTPEQMIPTHFKSTHQDDADKFEKIQNVYKKYRNKNFRIRVPDVFPVSSFRIWPEERTDDVLTNKFLAVFQHIASIETSSRVTHCVMKTDENGILETDSLNLLFWIFNGCIIVREQWMTDCIQNEKLIEQDYNYLVEKVRYKGVVYDTVLQWSNGMAKGEIPYLYGVQVAVVMKEYPNMFVLAGIVNSHGGIMLDEFPVKKKYNSGSHPYLHSHLGPLFIIHDGEIDLSAYAKDKMFSFFTEEEFLKFMLKREINRDTYENPISVLKEPE